MAQYLNMAGVEALWGKIKSTFALKSHSHNYVDAINANTDDYTNCISKPRIKTSYVSNQGDFGAITVPTYCSNSSSYFYQTELRFPIGSSLKYRIINHNKIGDFITLLDSSNYNSYSPTLTGTGASGTWGINVTGSSSSCTGNASSATKLTTNAGSATNPIYFSGGKPTACTYSLNKTVPANAVFTDTASGKTFKTLSGKSHTGWTNNTTDDKIIPTMSFMAYWDGSYASTGASNLTYCNQGAFGTAAVKNYTTSITSGSSNLITSGAVYTGLAGKSDTHSHPYLSTSGGSVSGPIFNTTSSTGDNLASYISTASTVTGTIKITLPVSWTSSMAMYEIWVYEYAGVLSGSKILVGGYNYGSGSWHNYTYSTQGTYTKGVRLAHDGSKCCILLGNTSSSWAYPQIYLKAVSSGFSGASRLITTGYSITAITSESNITSIVSVGRSNEYAGGFYQDSDERLKTFYDPIKVDLEKLKKLRKNYFKFNNKDELAIGVSAQEVQEIYPELVSANDEGYLSVAYDKLSVIALAAIDKQQDIIENQIDKINQLETQLKNIENVLKEKGIL